MTEIRLNQSWTLGKKLGSGGFGRVFAGSGPDGFQAAVKLVPKEPGASRELLFEDLTGVRNIVPIVDKGEWQDQWVLVMPLATMSLRDRLEQGAPLAAADAVSVLTDVATALADLSLRVVHRDIKPENVLLLEGRWCLSDFGIARYAEASTAEATHKFAGSPPYVAPERWRGEQATSASDVYSFGVMAYELLAGSCPFRGPDYREQHLLQDAQPLTGAPPPLASLIMSCMFKPASSRPDAPAILKQLSSALRPASQAAEQLRAANQLQAERIATAGRVQSTAKADAERRVELGKAGGLALKSLADRLAELVAEAAPLAAWESAPWKSVYGYGARLGQARLSMEESRPSTPESWGRLAPPFEVVAFAAIGIELPADRSGHEGRSHSLWYCDAQIAGRFRWFETAFMFHPYLGRQARLEPFALSPSENAGKAISPMVAEFQPALPFKAIEPGNDDEFLERWLGWFAAGAAGQYRRPMTMPEQNPLGSWRTR